MGMAVWVVAVAVLWAWWAPEEVGRWAAKVRAAYDKKTAELRGVE